MFTGSNAEPAEAPRHRLTFFFFFSGGEATST
jgi:hypothetical protein